MASKNLKLTSVKIVDHLFEDFKVSSIRHKFNLQKLANRAVHLYLTDEDFRKKLHNHTDLTISGSLQVKKIKVIFMKKGYIPKDKRKKILLLSDDIRTQSGIGTMSREIVLKTAHHFNWVNLGGAVKHP